MRRGDERVRMGGMLRCCCATVSRRANEDFYGPAASEGDRLSCGDCGGVLVYTNNGQGVAWETERLPLAAKVEP